MNCVNCTHPLQKIDKFCPSCGNQLFCERITVKSLINEFFSKYFSLDAKLWVTIKDMTLRPDQVIKSYFNNNRIKYLAPINYMIIAGLLGGFYAYLLNNGYLGEVDYSVFAPQAEQRENPFGMNQEEMTKSVVTEMQKYFNIVLFLTIPLLALISKLVFHNYKQFNFAEHSVIYAYAYSQFLILSYLTIPFALLFENFILYYSYLSYVFLIGYHAFVLKKVFQISWKKMIVKTLFFLFISIVAFTVIIIIGSILAFLYLLLSGKFSNP